MMACVGVCMANKSRSTRHYSLLKTVYSPVGCLVSDLIKNVYATTVCLRLCTCAVRVNVGSSLRQYAQSDAVLQSSEESF